jgi:hypothetical protein
MRQRTSIEGSAPSPIPPMRYEPSLAVYAQYPLEYPLNSAPTLLLG